MARMSVLLMVATLVSWSCKVEGPEQGQRAQVEKPAKAPKRAPTGRVLVSTASAEETPAEMLHPGRPTGKHLALPASVYTAGDTVRVSWFDTPGNPQDWVTVVPVGFPDDQWGDWAFTGGKKEGTLVVSGLGHGDYEARLYHDWPDGGFAVVERLGFIVSPSGPLLSGAVVRTKLLSLSAKTLAAGRPVIVGWQDTPGNDTDWLTVVPVGTPSDNWGPWMYTNGRKDGSFQVPALKPGEYEARLYFDWPDGGFEVEDRIHFSIR